MCIRLPELHAKNMDLQRAPIFLVAKLRSIPWSGQGCPLCRSVWACPGHPLHPPDLAVQKYPAPLLRPCAGGRSSSNRAPRRSHRCPKTPTPPRTEGRTRPPGSAAFRSCSSSAHSRICPGVGQKKNSLAMGGCPVSEPGFTWWTVSASHASLVPGMVIRVLL